MENQEDLKPYYNAYRKIAIQCGFDYMTFDEWLEVVEDQELFLDDEETFDEEDI